MRISDWSSDVCSSDLQQVLINLIRNAMEAMSGSPVRQLVISSRIQDRQFVRVSVEDSGPGVPKAIAENLFRAFVSTKAQGMGLDLSIRSEEHTSELQSLMRTSYAVFCLKKKNKRKYNQTKK